MLCLRAISGVSRADRLHNNHDRENTLTPESISDAIRHRRLIWPNKNVVKIAFNEGFKGHRKRKLDRTLNFRTAERCAIHRTKWRVCDIQEDGEESYWSRHLSQIKSSQVPPPVSSANGLSVHFIH